MKTPNMWAVVIAALLVAMPAGAGQDVETSVLKTTFEWSAAGGTYVGSQFRVQFGSSMVLNNQLHPELVDVQLPLSGLSYSRADGLTPILFGAPLASRNARLGADNSATTSDSGRYAWLAAGAALVGGVVMASGSGDRKRTASAAPPDESGPGNPPGSTPPPPEGDPTTWCNGVVLGQCIPSPY